MKTLKFFSELCEQILAGTKTSTWRLFDDKDLQAGDEVVFINKDTGKTIGTAVLDRVKVTTLGNVEDKDWVGHERYESEEEMYETYKSYYGDKVGPDSELKIIHFSFTPVKI